MAITLTFTPAGGGGTGFRQGKLGGGGHIAGFDFSPDGKTRLAHNDTTGGFIWHSPSGSANPVTDATGYWRNLWTTSSVPAYSHYTNLGFTDYNVYSMACAPSQPTTIYAVWPGENDGAAICKILKSTDRGVTWAYTGFAPAGFGQRAGHPGDRLFKPHMGVDPQNPNVVWVGDHTGLWYYTFDGGTTWATLSTSQIPLGASGAPNGEVGPNPQIAFDRNSALTSGRSSVLWIANGSRGVYKSSNGGTTWTAMAGGPSWVAKLRCDALGRLYVLRAGATTYDDLYWLDGSTWTHSTVQPSIAVHLSSFDINPFDNNEIMVVGSPGQMMRSTNRGVSWTAFYDHVPTRVATDIPWLAYTNEDNLSNVDCKFDPVVNGRLWLSGGIGMWYYDRPTNFGAAATAQTYTELTRGNDGLIVMALCKAPSGSLQCVAQDRVGLRLPNTDAYPVQDAAPPVYGKPIRHGWSIDYAANPSPHTTYIARTSSDDTWGYSTDDGVTWTGWTPSKTLYHGVIACSTATNSVLFEGWDGKQYYTTNGGTAWNLVTWKNTAGTTLSTAFFYDVPGFLGFYTERRPVCADRATAGTFYCYHWDYTNGTDGFYKSTDGGANFLKTAAAVIPGAYGSGSNHLKMAAAPGKAGHVFLATGYHGPSSFPNGTDLYFTSDGWATAQTGSFGFSTVVSVGFGKEASGKTYPAVYVYGIRGAQYGLWRCTDWDGAKTWELLTTSEAYNGTLDRIRDVVGDLDVYGRVYLAFASTGYAVGDTA
jgi:hypothetical protein